MQPRGRRGSALLAGALTLGLLGTPRPAAAGWAPEIAVTGNTRTRTGYLVDLVQDCLATQGAGSHQEIDPTALEQCVLDSELFSAVAVTIDTAVRVAVEERWTLIPMPFFQSQGDTRRGGLFLLESNFLGRGKLLVAGATVGNQGSSYLLVLKDPGIAFSPWTARCILRRGDEDVLRSRGRDVVAGFRLQEQVVRVQPGYQWTPQLEVGWFGEYVARRYGAADRFTAFPEDTAYGAWGPVVENGGSRQMNRS